MTNVFGVIVFIFALAIPGVGLAADAVPAMAGHGHVAQRAKPAQPVPAAPKLSKKSPAAEYTPNVRYRLRTELAEGKMAFVGVGGDIEGVVNPTLRVNDGDVVQVSLVNNDGIEHDVVFPDFSAGTDRVNRKGASSVTVFRADKSGEFPYFCSLPGHRQAGMEGKLVVGGAKGPVVVLPPSVSIARNASDLPGPLPLGAPRTLTIELEAIELVGKLASETTYNYWTFNGKVPGPFLRARVGDSALIGCGTYADSSLGGVSCPGDGEAIIRVVLARRALDYLKEADDPTYASRVAVDLLVEEGRGDGGLIMVDWRGRLGYAQSTPFMPVAWMSPAVGEPALPF